MDHECIQCDNIRKLEIDLAVAQSDIKTVKEDIKDISADIKASKNWTIATLVTVVLALVGFVISTIVK